MFFLRSSLLGVCNSGKCSALLWNQEVRKEVCSRERRFVLFLFYFAWLGAERFFAGMAGLGCLESLEIRLNF